MRNTTAQESDYTQEALMISIFIASVGLFTICVTLLRSI